MPHHATGSDARRRVSNTDAVIEQRRGSKTTSFEQSLLDFAARPLLQDVDLRESFDEKSVHRAHYGSGSSGSSSSSAPDTPDSVDAVHGRRFSLEASRQSPAGLSKRVIFMALLSLTSALAVAALVAVGLAGRFRSSHTSTLLGVSGSASRSTLPTTILASEIVTPHKHVHLLIPLTPNFHNAESCKTIMAAIVHGYEPIIVNWALTGDDYRGNQFAKISGGSGISWSSLLVSG